MVTYYLEVHQEFVVARLPKLRCAKARCRKNALPGYLHCYWHEREAVIAKDPGAKLKVIDGGHELSNSNFNAIVRRSNFEVIQGGLKAKDTGRTATEILSNS
jgi:hypothetical protein